MSERIEELRAALEDIKQAADGDLVGDMDEIWSIAHNALCADDKTRLLAPTDSRL